MKALTWHATKDVRVIEVPDAEITEPTDAVIRVTSTAICGSDLHLYGVFGPFLHRGDILGHETMGIVEAVGSDVRRISVGDRVVIPFVISCGHCFMCARGLTTQCETTQNRDHGTGAELYGYTELYGRVPGGQAQYLRVRRADANAQVVGHDLPDERYLFLSDILPTAWQGFAYANVIPGQTLTVLGLGPVGQLVTRIARHRDVQVHAVDPVAERRLMAERYGATVHDLHDDVADVIREATEGRGPDSRRGCRRPGGARQSRHGVRAVGRRRAAGQPREAAHDEGGRGSSGGAGHGHRPRASGRQRLGQRRLRGVPRSRCPS